MQPVSKYEQKPGKEEDGGITLHSHLKCLNNIILPEKNIIQNNDDYHDNNQDIFH